LNKHISIAALSLLHLTSATGSAIADEAGTLPKAEVREFSDTYFGSNVTDRYRWMEDAGSGEFKAWLKAQAAYASASLERLPTRA